MKTLKDRLSNMRPRSIYMITEYVIGIWVIITTIINLLNLYGIVNIHSFLMKPTFFGASLLIMLLLQYGLMRANKENKILNKIRPYVMGVMIADVFSVCNLPLCLMLTLLIGYFFASGLTKKCRPKEAALTFLIACVGMEVYSIVFLMQEKEIYDGMGLFLKSLWPDVLFIGAAFTYYMADRDISMVEEEQIQREGQKEKGEEEQNEEQNDEEKNEKTRRKKKILFWKKKRWIILQRILAWCQRDTARLARWTGCAMCIVSLGLFMFFAISVGVGTQKISQNTEEVYLLRHCEDVSFVLTLKQEEETGEYVFSFQKYMGTNNQKVHLRNMGNGLYQIIFLSPECAVGIDSQAEVYAEPGVYSEPQYWAKDVYDGEKGYYRFIGSNGALLCYSKLKEEPHYLAAGHKGDDYEVFVMEKTTGDEFITCMAAKHRDEFMPTLLMETCSTLLGSWTRVLYILVSAVLFGIIYLRRILGDKLAAMYALFFVFLLAYGSISAMFLLFVAIGLQCSCIYYRRTLRNVQKSAVSQS